MDYIIREILEEEYGLLEDFLYEAMFMWFIRKYKAKFTIHNSFLSS